MAAIVFVREDGSIRRAFHNNAADIIALATEELRCEDDENFEKRLEHARKLLSDGDVKWAS